jgi:hypothetical protein
MKYKPLLLVVPVAIAVTGIATAAQAVYVPPGGSATTTIPGDDEVGTCTLAGREPSVPDETVESVTIFMDCQLSPDVDRLFTWTVSTEDEEAILVLYDVLVSLDALEDNEDDFTVQ